MSNLITRFISDESGEDLIEYALMAAFVAGVATVIYVNDAGGIKTALTNALKAVSTKIGAAAA